MLKRLVPTAIAGVVAGFIAARFFFGGPATGAPSFELGAAEAPSSPFTAPGGGAGGCTVTDATATVAGNSMAGIVANGSTVTVEENYYACHDVARGDIVAYNYPGKPLIKKVFGVPGDTLALAPATSSVSGLVLTGWSILVNGKALVNSAGYPYVITASGHRMLSIYVNDYRGVIPPDSYLILGDTPWGSEDSTVFGLVGREDLLGKVVIGAA